MAVGFTVDMFWYHVGHGDLLHSFFSTISFHLEPDRWGSKYPYLLNNLYSGELSWEKAPNAIREAKEARSKLANFTPDQVIWDIEDLSKQPPWGSNISPDISSLADYFVTSEGKDLFDILLNALEKSWRKKANIEIESVKWEDVIYVKFV